MNEQEIRSLARLTLHESLLENLWVALLSSSPDPARELERLRDASMTDLANLWARGPDSRALASELTPLLQELGLRFWLKVEARLECGDR